MKSDMFQEGDADLISGKTPWPMKVMLCLKRYEGVQPGSFPDFGFLYEGQGWKVFRNNRFPRFLLDKSPVEEDLANNNYHDYQSMEELVNDGWIVD